jgi:TonB-dependent starch-binding outer membrane protein SusC
LDQDNKTLDEVMVIGYGTAKKSQVVGSVSSVKSEELTKQPMLTAAQGLQGKTTGIQIIGSGEPGTQPQVRIRGTNTITADANPIYVVDGVITSDVTNIATSDIESMDVLKDAASQAIYGSRAANGVILITTKAGKTGKVKVSFDSYFGVKSMTSKVKMADAQTYAAYTNEARAYDGQAAMFDLSTIKNNTNWFDAITQDGLVQNYNMTISGGTDAVTYYFSANQFGDQGILKGNNYNRTLLRNSNTYKLGKYIKLGHTLNLSFSKNNIKPNEFADAYRIGSTAPVKDENGNYGYVNGLSVANPLAALDYTHHFKNDTRLQGNAFAEINPIPELTIRSSFNFNKDDNKETTYVPKYYVSSVQQTATSKLTLDNVGSSYYIIDNNINFHKTFFEKHEVNVTGGHSSEKDKGSTLEGSRTGVSSQENLWYLDQGDVNSATNTSTGYNKQRESWYGRLIYTFDSKYNLSGVLRRDGSSVFPVDHKWGTFYSFGGSWIVNHENFMANQHVFDELKLRASYGKIGNDNLPYGTGTLTSVTTTGAYNFGGNSNPVSQGLTFDQIKDVTITWETTKGFDAGIEFSTLGRRLSGEVSYYNKLTNAYVPITMPTASGDADNKVISQAADVRNSGIEFNLNWKQRVNKDFSYHAGFNITFNTNNVDKVRGGLQLKDGSLGNGNIVTYTVEGQPIGSFWVYKTDGIYKTQAEVDNSPHLTGTKAGDLKLVDVNGDNVINDKDREFVGSYQPKTYFGLNLGFDYKSFDFSVDCYGNLGNKIFNGKKAVRFGNDNIESARAADRWSTTNPNGTQPRASNAIPAPSDYFVESGDFFRINNMTVGYSLPAEKWHVGLSKLRVYATAQNPLILKKYSGFTPELPGSATSSGIELSIYPVSTTYLVGVNVSF